MTAMISHLQKALLRHHMPLIPLRYTLNQSRSNSSTQSSNENKNESTLVKHIDTSSSQSNQMQSTQKTTSLDFSQTPKKYRRRPLTQDEIELVTVGGLR